MFGKHLQLARKKAGYSLRGLSYALDGEVTAQAIGKYERGEMMPRSSVLIHLASVLGVFTGISAQRTRRVTQILQISQALGHERQ